MDWDIVFLIIYIVEGVCIIGFNALIVLTVWRHEALSSRKEYVALAASALADGAYAFGLLTAAFYRIPLWYMGSYQEAASGRFCLLMPHNIFLGLFGVASFLMLVVVSWDRVLSVAIPLKYMSLTRMYSYGMIALAYGSSFALYFLIFTTNWQITDEIRTKVCYGSAAFGVYTGVRDQIMATCTFVSIGLYMLVPLCYCVSSGVAPGERSTNAPSAHSKASAAVNVSFQKDLNKSVAVSCLFTLLCVGLPRLVVAVVETLIPELYDLVDVLGYVVSNIDPAVNFFIYYRKLKYFRIGVKALFKNKTLPPLLSSWHESNIGGSSAAARNNFVL